MGTPTTETFKITTVEKGIRQVGPRRWEVRVFAGRHPVTGAVRHVSRTTTKGITDARKIRARLITEVAAGQFGNGTAGTFGELLDLWLRDGRQDRAETTLDSYRSHIETAIRPALGAIPLLDLTARDMDSFYATMIANGTSPAMVKHYHRVISAAIRQAEKWGMVPTNVARNATPPRVPVKPLTVPPPERVRQLIARATESGNLDLAALITVAATTGMRRGEVCGLQWSDIDWDEPALTVRRSIFQAKELGWGVKDPKTHQIRRVHLGESAVTVLRERQNRVAEAVDLAEVKLAPDAYVFSDDLIGAHPVLPNTMTLRFRSLCRKMEELTGEPWPYRLHDLRHYTATELFRAGHNPRTVADRLGHADPALTLRVYTHDTEDQAIAAADALEAGLAG